MFYEVIAKGHIRIPPRLLSGDVKDAIMNNLNNTLDLNVPAELGIVVDISEIIEVGEGIIIPGDGAAYYDTTFKMIIFRPEMQEIVIGKIQEVADFGAFIDIGPIDGMIHISQTMDDFVSFSKTGELQGKETKRILKVNDKCRARIVAISYKDISNPKIGLTMRQPMLGQLHYIEEDLKKVEKGEKKK